VVKECECQRRPRMCCSAATPHSYPRQTGETIASRQPRRHIKDVLPTSSAMMLLLLLLLLLDAGTVLSLTEASQSITADDNFSTDSLTS